MILYTAKVNTDSRVFDVSLLKNHGQLEERAVTSCRHAPIHSGRVREWIDMVDLSQFAVISDVRDVVVQRPLSWLPMDHMVHLYEENMVIGKCPYNSEWICRLYGAGVLDEIRHKPVICSGIYHGFGAQVHGLLSQMWREIEQRNGHMLGGDQAVLNYLYHTNRIEFPVMSHSHDSSSVYTVGYLPRNSLIVRDGIIELPSGETPVMVHQYDRHFAQVEQIIKRYL